MTKLELDVSGVALDRASAFVSAYWDLEVFLQERLAEIEEDIASGPLFFGVIARELEEIGRRRGALSSLRASGLPRARPTADKLDQAFLILVSAAEAADLLADGKAAGDPLKLAHMAYTTMEDALVGFKAIGRPHRFA
jgi:hypothetical protein